MPIAFDYLTPPEICAAFSSALNVPVRYVQGQIKYLVPIPAGYKEELETIQKVLGSPSVSGLGAPYWWSGFFEPLISAQPESGSQHPSASEQEAIVKIAQTLWPGWRGIEEYVGDAFIVEEYHNGKKWMNSDESAEVSEEEDGTDGELEMAAARPL